ncbi:hypothetical protein COPCOM_01983 [Coprococcus comes ATCC 27758]|uniref:Uncharacterized protein n=1 Tax=Coprococcus comes ATCC 27758 TaxID=470146 RepID=C0BA05_9FIRM|nr:hypothetical protein COPCOM_01983 [Coprococcus comes ATCC 27758]
MEKYRRFWYDKNLAFFFGRYWKNNRDKNAIKVGRTVDNRCVRFV